MDLAHQTALHAGQQSNAAGCALQTRGASHLQSSAVCLGLQERIRGRGATIDGHGNVVCVRKVECYVPTTDTWVVLAPMTQPRAEAGCAVLGNNIYIVGGYSWDDNKRLRYVTH